MKMKKGINFLKAFLLPLIFFLVFSIASKGRMATVPNVLSILQQAVYPAVIAFGMYNICELGLWDLASGATIICASVLGGNIAYRNNWGVAGLIACVILLCLVMTCVTCTVQLTAQIPSMIVSIGMVMVYETVAAMSFSGSFSVPREWTFFSRAPYCYVILIVTMALMLYLVHYTKFGYDVRALGYGKEIAMNIGVNIPKTMYKVYLLQGLMLGCAALLYMSMNGAASAAMNLGTTSVGFNGIVCVLVAECLAVYCGPMVGVFVGAVTLRVLSTGLLALGFAATWQKFANGIFLILFLGFSQNQQLIAAMHQRKKKISELEKKISSIE